MKRILTVILLAISCICQGQEEEATERLIVYGQVWGFLKYFHPEPGYRDWDQVLLDNYEIVKNCKSREAFNITLSDLLEICKDYEPIPREVNDSMLFHQSFEWIENELISADNKAWLHHLRLNKPAFKNKYIKGAFVGSPDITGENKYETFVFSPAVNYLAVTRYWNIINYYYPYRDLIPKQWTAVYRAHIPEFISASTYDAYYFAVRNLTTEIRDAHGFIRTENNPMERYKFAPFYCESVSDGVFVKLVWQDTLQPFDLQPMDRLVAIDGKTIEEKWEEISRVVSTSNDYYLSKATYYLRISDKDTMVITVERNGELITDTLLTIDRETLQSRYKPTQSNGEKSSYAFLKDSVSGKEYAYIHMGRLKSSEITHTFQRKLHKTDHVIIDIRNYPNWTVLKLSDALIKGKRNFAKFIKMDFNYPGSFEWTTSQTIGNKRKEYKGKLYILVDYNTMSQAEYTVMALQQHPNTTVIGGQTAGADGNIVEIPLPFGIRSVFSGLGVYYPNGTGTQQVGVKRDIPVVQDKSYIESGNDLIMNKALELIRNE